MYPYIYYLRSRIICSYCILRLNTVTFYSRSIYFYLLLVNYSSDLSPDDQVAMAKDEKDLRNLLNEFLVGFA